MPILLVGAQENIWTTSIAGSGCPFLRVVVRGQAQKAELATGLTGRYLDRWLGELSQERGHHRTRRSERSW